MNSTQLTFYKLLSAISFEKSVVFINVELLKEFIDLIRTKAKSILNQCAFINNLKPGNKGN